MFLRQTLGSTAVDAASDGIVAVSQCSVTLTRVERFGGDAVGLARHLVETLGGGRVRAGRDDRPDEDLPVRVPLHRVLHKGWRGGPSLISLRNFLD